MNTHYGKKCPSLWKLDHNLRDWYERDEQYLIHMTINRPTNHSFRRFNFGRPDGLRREFSVTCACSWLTAGTLEVVGRDDVGREAAVLSLDWGLEADGWACWLKKIYVKKWFKKYNAELQRTDTGTKVMGEFKTKGCIFPPNAQNVLLLFPWSYQ